MPAAWTPPFGGGKAASARHPQCGAYIRRVNRVTGIALSLGSHHLAMLVCLLPRRERGRIARRLGLDLRPANLELGMIEFLGGSTFGSVAFLGYAEALSGMKTGGLAMGVEPAQAPILPGPLTFFSFLLTPAGAIAAYATLAGVLRLVAHVVTDEECGDPLVSFAVVAARGLAVFGSAWREHRIYGPERPDRLLSEPGCDLVVLSSRDKPGWNELVTLRIGDRFYRVVGVEEREDGPHRARAYLLREADPREVIRGLVVFDPPVPGRGAVDRARG